MARATAYIQPEVNVSYPDIINRVRWVTDDGIKAENTALNKDVSKMSKRIAELEKRIPKEKVLVLRSITREQAKDDMRELFKTGRVLYYSDVVEELGIDLRSVVEICDELKGDGELAVA